MIFNRLAVGTANWGKEYNGAKVSEDDQKRILDYCQCSGIDTIDTATAYEWDWTKVSSYFKVVVKIRENDPTPLDAWCIMAHDSKAIDRANDLWGMGFPAWGISVYEPKEAKYNVDVLQAPYSLYDRRFEQVFVELKNKLNPVSAEYIHVRSVFLRGRILKEIEPWKCIAFCLMNPYIDKVIIGANSFEQFKENLRPFHQFVNMEKSDLNLLDTRRW